MATTTLTAHVTWATYGARLKFQIGEDPAAGAPEDTLKDYLAMGAEIGDKYLGRELPDPPPRNPVHGCLAYARALWQWTTRPDGLKAVKTGQLAETYADPGTEGARAAALAAALPFWKPYKRDLTLAGALKK